MAAAVSGSPFPSYVSSEKPFNRVPARRGRIKARIFKSLIEKVAAAVHIRRITAPMATQDNRSDLPIVPTSTTPLSSSYNSDE